MTKRALRNIKESAIKAFFFTNGILAVIVLVGIFALLLSSAVPAFREIKISEFLGRHAVGSDLSDRGPNTASCP